MDSGSLDPQNIFDSFKRRREDINEKMAQKHVEVHQLLERLPVPPTLEGLAHLEVMIAERGELCRQLAALDDEFITFLVNLRSGKVEGENSPHS